MLDALKFVRGAVKDTDTVMPVLTHFCIYKGRIQGTNGRVSIDSPGKDLDFEAVLPADKFLSAIDACKGKPTMRFTDGGKFTIESKPFRVFLPHHKVEAFPLQVPSKGKKRTVGKDLIKVLALLRPFVGEDASRPWASTILFRKSAGMAVAANNAMIAAAPSKETFVQDIMLPIFAIDELLRIKDVPEYFSTDEVSVTFFWGEQWLRSQLIIAEYPAVTVDKWLEKKGKMIFLPEDIRSTIEKLAPFCNDPKFPVLYFSKKGIATAPGETQAEIAGIDLGEGVFRADNLKIILQRSDKIAITADAALFSGPSGFRAIMAPLKTT